MNPHAPPKYGRTRDAILTAPPGAWYVAPSPGYVRRLARHLRRDDLVVLGPEEAANGSRSGFPVLDHGLAEKASPEVNEILKAWETDAWRRT
jgi:hypothetical protein